MCTRKWVGLMAAAMALGLSGCGGETVSPPEQTVAPYVKSEEDASVDYESNAVFAGSVTTGLASSGGGQVGQDIYAGTAGKDYTDPQVYTFRDYTAGTTDMKWSPLNWQTSADSYIVEQTTMGLYSFVLNSTGDGWSVACEMAARLPVDVTAEYVGQYGIEKGEKARAWKISLNPNACWEDGTPINADTYLYSYKELLDPVMKNRRADSLYAGDFAVVNAKRFFYGEIEDFDQVGILKTGDYELVFVTENPIESPDYYVPYNLSTTYLVYEPLWESCKTYFNSSGQTVGADSGDIASITTNYCTSLQTSISYGPYRLSYFERDKQITMSRNEAWYGYSDGKHLGQYQTDVIDCQVIGEQSTALLAFLNGELDNVDLTQADMAAYAASDRVRYTPETYTTKLTFNTDEKSLTERGAQILVNPHFRQAFSLAIDRGTFAAAYTSAGSAGYGLLNNMYVYDPFTGAAYRDTRGAKEALVKLHGLSYGEEGEYETLDDAYEAITGYDPHKAQALMSLAYEEAVAAGLYDGVSQIRLRLSVASADTVYVQMFNYLNNCLKAACEGTGFAGKVSLEMVVDADYYTTMYSGGTDMIFSTWGGSAYSPYSLLNQCYCDAPDGSGNQMEYGFDTAKVNVTIQIDGVNYTESLQTWARWADSDVSVVISSEDGTAALGRFGDFDAATRAELFSRLEYAYLSFYPTTPLYYRNGASMISRKGDYPLRQYVEPVNFGELRFYTYDYSDDQWAQVKDELEY